MPKTENSGILAQFESMMKKDVLSSLGSFNLADLTLRIDTISIDGRNREEF